jgi:peptidylprolyl isomerase
VRTFRRPLVLAALATMTALTVGLTGCGSDSEDSGSDDATSTTSDSGIEVTGSFGEKPTITVPEGDPPDELVVEVLEDGDGAEVASGDLLVADYLGQTWEPTDEADPNVFDNSYDRGEPAGFGIGTGAVIPGWDEGLVGQTIGSRVLLTIPPDQGYGDQEQEQIPAGSTLVFVVDIVNSVDSSGTVSGTPATDIPAGLPTVEGDGADAAPTVTFPAGTPEPTTATTAVLINGDGAPLETNLVANVLQVAWGTGEVQYSSWQNGSPETLTADQLPGLTEALAGQKVGTRVLVAVPKAETGTDTSIALVIDIIGTY